MSLNLSRLWLYTIFIASVLIIFTAVCADRSVVPVLPSTQSENSQVVSEETAVDSSRAASPTYTYVGEVARAAEENGDEVPGTTESLIRRKTDVDTVSGAIPDLDIGLNGNRIQRVMAHYGYVPAMKTKARLLGKIVDDTFVPLSPKEIGSFANRGRSGESFPHADEWRTRVAREFDIPVDAVQCIFLVPHRTEQFFIDAQRQAVARAGRREDDIALVRAHFAADLVLVVDALLAKSGETIPVDSVECRLKP